DIGGTKTALAIYSSETGPYAPLAQTEVHSADYGGLETIAREFLTKAKGQVDVACFAVAGPVMSGRAKITNLPWVIDESIVAKELNLERIHLMNDLEAIAFAIPRLRTNDLHTLNAGAPLPGSAIGVIAPGTGLGESFLTWDGSRYVAHSSEGGHASYAPTDEMQMGLLAYMLKRFDHVSYEHVCSGIGIPHIYEYLRSSGYASEGPEVAEAIAAAYDPSPAIIKFGLDPGHPSVLCATTLDILISILGDEAGNLALKVLATGGVYLAGGIATHVLPALKGQSFMQSFRRKGRFAELMARIPIHVILNQAALAGAASYGLENLMHRSDPG
ncbi:MAG TPA: glucokinase, partial [Terriglobia bacterium]|nr:glucokinase [Terriglobia bacterium]